MVMAITIGLASVVVALLFSRLTAQSEARIEDLSSQQRLELYSRTLADLELCATDAGKALGEHCAHQARLISQFAECDQHCRKLAAAWQSLPSR